MRTIALVVLCSCGVPPLQKIHAEPITVNIWSSECQRCAEDFRKAVEIINQKEPLVTIDERPFSVDTAIEFRGEISVHFVRMTDKEGAAPLAKSSGRLELSSDLLDAGYTDDELVFASLHELGHVFGLPHQFRGVMCGPPAADNDACAHGDEIRALNSWELTIAEFLAELN